MSSVVDDGKKAGMKKQRVGVVEQEKLEPWQRVAGRRESCWDDGEEQAQTQKGRQELPVVGSSRENGGTVFQIQGMAVGRQ